MKRRGVLLTLLAAAGCLGDGGFDAPPDGSPDAAESTTPTATPAETSATTGVGVRVESFTETERCASSGVAAVSVDDADVVVRGCVRGANGCAAPALSAAAYDAGANALTVIVGTDARGDADACTRVRTHLGYRVRVVVEGLPDTVSVVHDDAGGHREVAHRNVTA